MFDDILKTIRKKKDEITSTLVQGWNDPSSKLNKGNVVRSIGASARDTFQPIQNSKRVAGPLDWIVSKPPEIKLSQNIKNPIARTVAGIGEGMINDTLQSPNVAYEGAKQLLTKPLSISNTLSSASKIVDPIINNPFIGVGGQAVKTGGKIILKTGKQGLKQLVKQGLKQIVKQGAEGGLMGGLYGLHTGIKQLDEKDTLLSGLSKVGGNALAGGGAGLLLGGVTPIATGLLKQGGKQLIKLSSKQENKAINQLEQQAREKLHNIMYETRGEKILHEADKRIKLKKGFIGEMPNSQNFDLKRSLEDLTNYRNVSKIKGTQVASRFKDISQADTMDIIKAIESPSYSIRDDLKPFVEDIKRVFTEQYDDAIKRGLTMSKRENYITHIWDRPVEEIELQYKALKDKMGFQNNRKIPTYEEGLQMGLKPKYDRIAQIVEDYVSSKERTIADLDFLKEIKNKGYASADEFTNAVEMKLPGVPKDFFAKTPSNIPEFDRKMIRDMKSAYYEDKSKYTKPLNGWDTKSVAKNPYPAYREYRKMTNKIKKLEKTLGKYTEPINLPFGFNENEIIGMIDKYNRDKDSLIKKVAGTVDEHRLMFDKKWSPESVQENKYLAYIDYKNREKRIVKMNEKASSDKENAGRYIRTMRFAQQENQKLRSMLGKYFDYFEIANTPSFRKRSEIAELHDLISEAQALGQIINTSSVGGKLSRNVLKTPTLITDILDFDSNNPVKQSLYVHKDIAPDLKKAFDLESPNFLNRTLGATASINSELTNVQMSGGVPLTPFNGFGVALALREFITNPIRSMGTISKSFRFSDKEALNYFDKNAEQLIKMTKGTAKEVGIPMDTIYNMDNIMSGIGQKLKNAITDVKDGNVVTKNYKRLNNIIDVTLGSPTFKRMLPMFQVDMFNDIERQAIKKGMSPEDATSTALRAVKNFWGIDGFFTKALNNNEYVKNVAKTLLFAPGYRAGLLDSFVNTGKALLNPTKLENQKNLQFLGGVVVTGIVYDIANRYLTGNSILDNPEGKETTLLAPMGDKTLGLPFLPSIATVPRIAMASGRKFMQGDFEGGVKELVPFLATPLQTIGRIIKNENYYGQEIVDPKADKVTQYQQIASYVWDNLMQPHIKTAVSLASNTPSSKQFVPSSVDSGIDPFEQSVKLTEAPIRFYSTAGVNYQKEIKDRSTIYDKKYSELTPDQKQTIIAVITEVIDGDTVVLDSGEHVRLLGVDTPETVKEGTFQQYMGKEASDYTKKSLIGKKVRLKTDLEDKDKYGRLLRYIETAPMGQDWLYDVPIVDKLVPSSDFNKTLLEKGLAKKTTFDIKKKDAYKQIASQAENKGVGVYDKEAKKQFYDEHYNTNIDDIYNTDETKFYFKNGKPITYGEYKKNKSTISRIINNDKLTDGEKLGALSEKGIYNDEIKAYLLEKTGMIKIASNKMKTQAGVGVGSEDKSNLISFKKYSTTNKKEFNIVEDSNEKSKLKTLKLKNAKATSIKIKAPRISVASGRKITLQKAKKRKVVMKKQKLQIKI